jgi:hypothetical protein
MVQLVKARVGKEIFPAANEVRDQVERWVLEDGYLDGAPFSWVGLIVREGLKDDTEPEIGRIDKKYGDLELAIEIDTHRLLGQTKERMSEVLRQASLRALVAAGRRYQRPMKRLEAELERMESN